MNNKKLMKRIIVLALIILVIAVIPITWFGQKAKANSSPPPPPSPKFSEPSREAGSPEDYYDLPYQYLYPVTVYKFENFGTYTINAATAGGENAFVMCWSGGKWSDSQVKNVRYDPQDITLRFKVVGAPNICAVFNGG